MAAKPDRAEAGLARRAADADARGVPRCTVAIPVYNREALVCRALESALAQDLDGLEVLVVDNCSTDGTWQALARYEDSRLRVVRNETNLGLFGNFNRCLELARGEYLRFLCSDDRLTPGCLAREIEAMERHPRVAVVSTRGRRVDDTGRTLGPQGEHFPAGVYPGRDAIHAVLWYQAHYAMNPLNYPSGILLRRESAARAGGFDTRMRMSGDVGLFLRMLEDSDLAVMDHVGCEIGIHAAQEGVRLSADTAPLRELIGQVEAYRCEFEARGTYARTRAQLAAYALGLAWKARQGGNQEARRAHLDVARSLGAGRAATAFAVGRLMGLRMLMRVAGKRLTPLRRGGAV